MNDFALAPSAKPNRRAIFAVVASLPAFLASASARAMVGTLGERKSDMNMQTSILPKFPHTERAATGDWDRLFTRFCAARVASEAFFDSTYGPLLDRHPPLPKVNIQVGTEQGTGKPIMKWFSLAELDGDEPFFLRKQWMEAKKSLIEHREAVEKFERETGFSSIEAHHDELDSKMYYLGRELLRTPAPDCRALSVKIDLMLNFGRYEWDEEGTIIATDAARLSACGAPADNRQAPAELW